MNDILPIILSAFFTGLAGGAHCLGMCGGIATALGMHSRHRAHLLAYQAGRLFSYTCLGFICGWLLPLLGLHPAMGGTGLLIRRISSLVIAAIGLMQLLDISPLRQLERYGYRLWRPLNRFVQQLLPIRSHADAFLVGSLWGLLPCGLIYAALAIAVSRAQPLHSAAVMFGFGLGTLPAMLGLGFFSRQLARSLADSRWRRLLGLPILLTAYWSWP